MSDDRAGRPATQDPTPTPPPSPGRTAPAGDRGDDAPDPRRWKALAVCLVSGFMTLLDVSIVNVALPSVRADLDASGSDLQWVLSGYVLAFGLALVPAGRLGDARGRRKVFVAGLVVFTLGSLLCGLAPTAGALLGARLLQGVGGGMLQPQVAAFIQSLFRGPERGRAFGLLGTSIGVSTAVGPLLGGLLLTADPDPWAWRLVFLVNLPVGVLGLVLALRWLPADRPATGPDRRRADLDGVGVLLLAGALVALLLPLLEQPSSVVGWLLWPLAVGLGVAFVAWERARTRRGRDAVVDLGLFTGARGPGYRNGVLVGLVYFSGFTTVFFVLSIYLQDGLGMTPLQAGLTQTPFAVGGAVTPVLAGRLVDRWGRRLVVGGLVVAVVGLAATLVVVAVAAGSTSPGTLGLLLALPLLVAGSGSGAVISPNTTMTLSTVAPERSGSASGVLQTSQRIGSAIGIAVVGAVFFRVAGGGAGADGGGGGAGGGDLAAGLVAGLAVATGLVALSLVPALVDLRAQHRAAPRAAR